MGHAAFLDLLLCDHGLVNLLRFGVHLGFLELRLAVVALRCHSLLLTLESLHQNVVSPVEAELLEPLVDLLYFLAAQLIHARLRVDRADELRVRVTLRSLLTYAEAENRGEEDSQVRDDDPLPVVLRLVILASLVLSLASFHRL